MSGPAVRGACWCFALVILMVAPFGGALARHDADAISAALLQRAGEAQLVGPERAASHPALTQAVLDAYRDRDWRPVWFVSGSVAEEAAARARLAAALAVLEDAAREGLGPEDYAVAVRAEGLPGFAARATPQGLAPLDAQATAAILAYARDAATGRRGPARLDSNVFAPPRDFDAAAILEALADPTRDAGAMLRALSPGHTEYRGLRRALSLYRALAEKPEPPPVPDGPSLKPGIRDPRVAALRARLAHFGDISVPEAEPDLFTPALEIALASFQRRHGLETDGIAGKQTLAALNVTVAERVDQILLNMERWRWLPHDLGPRYVLANIAGYEVTMVEGTSTVDRMVAVVGRPYRMTPVFSDRISYIEVNPTWTVPPKIAREDLLPKIQADPAYLESGGYEVFSGWDADAARLDPQAVDWQAMTKERFGFKLRQAPGPKNALGEVKIMFPNRFDIYLHDSPAKDLFDRRVRAFSSGCIRLARPFDLVDWLMRQTGGPDRAAIEEIRQSRETRVVKLPETVPVHLIYATAWAGEDGQTHFRADVYERDRLLARALAEERQKP